MRICLVVFLFVVNSCFGQKSWEIEFMPGMASYSGDLTQKAFSFHTIGPAANLNLKYNTGDFIIVRMGLAWGHIEGSDKYNTNPDLRARNLNFQTFISEANLCIELNLVDPDTYYSYPYLFGGVGVFHFNPYTYDNAGKKTFLQPLSTEGEGLPEYPGRKKYSLTQFCLPFGGGWKTNINDKFSISVEIGIRYLFTDYLDDVSTTYVDPKILLAERGPIAVELASRQAAPVVPGDIRGNPGVKDMYAFGGIKFGYYFGRKK